MNKIHYRGSGTTRREHVRIAEKVLGKQLPVGAVVHHVDKNGCNNVRSNLVICSTQKYHLLLHSRERALDACGNANFKYCSFCKQWGDATHSSWGVSKPKRGDVWYFHRNCINAYHQVRKTRIYQEMDKCLNWYLTGMGWTGGGK